ncbi:MAG: hypothetical protein Q4E88_00860 [Coriobacteriia bacterium]|nr:hypothetical protein [Coriobacteriia bacterium]
MDKVEFKIQLAEKNIQVSCLHSLTQDMCKDYLTDENPDFKVNIIQEDIDAEQDASYSDDYLETLAIYRKIATKMLDYDTFLFHGSAIAVDDVAYLFAGISGVGKSTHAALWCKNLESRARMINDDKPLIKISDDGLAYVYGTPWDGKHHRSNNICAPLKAICMINQADENKITELDDFTPILKQIYKPESADKVIQTLNLADKMLRSVKLYNLECRPDIEAAKIAFERMSQ